MAKIERLREVLSYCPDTGVLTWKVATSNAVRVGQAAGAKRKNGYLQVRVDKKMYLCHRAAWAMVHGAWPDGEIDHINGDKADNRLANLRVVDRRTNAENMRHALAHNISGFLGVSPKNGRFSASIRSRGEYKWLGMFQTAEEASDAYVAAKRQIHAGCTL